MLYLRAKDVGSPPLTNVRFPWKRDAALPFARATPAQPRAPQDRRSPCLDRERNISENYSRVLKLIVEIASINSRRVYYNFRGHFAVSPLSLKDS